MSRLSRSRPSRTWWVLVMFVLVTAMPTVSRAMAFVQGQIAPWAMVCSAVEEGGNTPADAASHLADHCPACVLQADHLGPPSVEPVAWQHLLHLAEVPLLFLQAPRPLFAWASAQPRAPPAVS